MLKALDKNTYMDSLLGQAIFAENAVGKHIVKPMDKNMAIVVYPNGDHNTHPTVGAEFNKGLRTFYMPVDGKEPLVKTLDEVEFATVTHGIWKDEPAMVVRHKNESGIFTGKTALVMGTGNQFIYMAGTVDAMIQRGEIIIHTIDK